MARPTRNRKSTQYLIKWKGYPASENSWLPEKELTNARELLDQFKRKHSSRQERNMLALQAQQRPKEGILSRTQFATSSITSSKSKVPQVNPVIRPARDPEKQGARAKPSGDLVSRDQIPDISRVLSRDKSRDATRFGWARSPLINQWQTVGTAHNQRRHVTPVIG
jgi:Chromo (CHRromatin Organisation MOdifier) domain